MKPQNLRIALLRMTTIKVSISTYFSKLGFDEKRAKPSLNIRDVDDIEISIVPEHPYQLTSLPEKQKKLIKRKNRFEKNQWNPSNNQKIDLIHTSK